MPCWRASARRPRRNSPRSTARSPSSTRAPTASAASAASRSTLAACRRCRIPTAAFPAPREPARPAPRMPQYQAPLREIRYVMHEVLGASAHYRELGREDVNQELIDSVLDECARFAENVIA